MLREIDVRLSIFGGSFGGLALLRLMAVERLNLSVSKMYTSFGDIENSDL